MTVKCFFNDCGFCKFGDKCRFKHSEQVCRKRTCQNNSCPRRHPKRCRNFFLKKYCKFGRQCKFDHSFDCEDCENMTYLVDKEIKKETEKASVEQEAIAKKAEEISNLERDNLQLKEDKTKLAKN